MSGHNKLIEYGYTLDKYDGFDYYDCGRTGIHIFDNNLVKVQYGAVEAVHLSPLIIEAIYLILKERGAYNDALPE